MLTITTTSLQVRPTRHPLPQPLPPRPRIRRRRRHRRPRRRLPRHPLARRLLPSISIIIITIPATVPRRPILPNLITITNVPTLPGPVRPAPQTQQLQLQLVLS